MYNYCDNHPKGTDKTHNCELIVLTGGPGAGKTAVLESFKQLLCDYIAILPEAASIVFNGGFWRLESDNAKLALQRAIYQVQKEIENLVLGESKWGIGLCDRGTLDGLAYWVGSESSFWDTFETTKEKEYSKYKAVLHLRTPTLEQGYNHQNPVRLETATEAREIDHRIHDIWKDHPNYTIVNSTNTFLEKANKAFTIFENLIPESCKCNYGAKT